MTQITFTLKDESKLMLILSWLKSLDTVRDIVATPIQLTRKQLDMRNDLEDSLHEVALHQQGKIALKTWAELRTELETD